MTPEQIAADRIAWALHDDGWLAGGPAKEAARVAVEAISAAGLVLVPAATLAAMIDAQEASNA
jgi:hypothetical protein